MGPVAIGLWSTDIADSLLESSHCWRASMPLGVLQRHWLSKLLCTWVECVQSESLDAVIMSGMRVWWAWCLFGDTGVMVCNCN